MKKTIKKIIATVSVLTLVAATFAACTSNNSAENDDTKKDIMKVGVIQYVSHSSLDNCYDGIEKGLKESAIADKIEIDFQNGNGDSSTCDAIAKKMVSEKYDMIIGIATPAVISAYSAAKDTDIPVIFCSVSDPVAAGITQSLDAPGGNCSGTSDILDFASQLEIIKAFQPDVKKIGVLYTTSEANSVSQLKDLTEKASAVGIEIIGQGVQGAADVPQAATTLISKVDCINNLTDNNVVDNLTVVLEKANGAGIPVYGSEIEQVKKGCLASYSIDYVALGVDTAKMAIEVLNGADISKMPVQKISTGTPVANSDVMGRFKMTTPEKYSSIEMVTLAA